MNKYRIFGWYLSNGNKCPFDCIVRADNFFNAKLIVFGKLALVESFNGNSFLIGDYSIYSF